MIHARRDCLAAAAALRTTEWPASSTVPKVGLVRLEDTLQQYPHAPAVPDRARVDPVSESGVHSADTLWPHGPAPAPGRRACRSGAVGLSTCSSPLGIGVRAKAGPRPSRPLLEGDGPAHASRDVCLRGLLRPESSGADPVLAAGPGLHISRPSGGPSKGGSARRPRRLREPPRKPTPAPSLPSRHLQRSSAQGPGRRSRSPAGPPRCRGSRSW